MALASLAFLAWTMRVELVVLFAAVLFGATLYSAARWLAGLAGIPHGLAVGIWYALTLALVAGFFVFAGQRLSDQYGELSERIPSALRTVESRLSGTPVLGALGSQLGELAGGAGEEGGGESGGTAGEEVSSGSGTMHVAQVTLRTLSRVGLVLLLSLYLALDGRRYTEALLRLLPPGHRDVGEDLASAWGTALPWWMVGRLASMAIVALLTVPGLLILHIPLAFVLALMAGLFSFVPVLGPIAALVPAVLVTLEAAPGKIVWVLALYAAVQLLESWVVTPRIQDKVSETPPFLLLSAQLTAGVLVGIAGVMFSTPMALAVLVFIQVAYLRHGLEEDVEVAGSQVG